VSNESTSRPNGASRRIIDEFGGNAVLLIALIVLLTVVPFLPGHNTEDIVTRLVWTAVIVAGLLRASGRRGFLWIALLLAVPSLLSRWFEIPGVTVARPLVVSLFLLSICAHILADIFQRRQIEIDQILGGVNVYLLLGVLFARLHVAIETLTPGSYMLGDATLATASAQAGQQLEDILQYFSFTSLTTLGYGDVRPVSHAARMLSAGEAVIGQLFVAIFIARLVSIYATRPDED